MTTVSQRTFPSYKVNYLSILFSLIFDADGLDILAIQVMETIHLSYFNALAVSKLIEDTYKPKENKSDENTKSRLEQVNY